MELTAYELFQLEKYGNILPDSEPEEDQGKTAFAELMEEIKMKYE